MTSTVVSRIERRLLVNYRIAPEHVAPLLPAPFRPQLVRGHAVGGVCFIRLAQIRTPKIPKALGIRTENAAHRFAVEWDDRDGTHTGVYIPRRDTDSWITLTAGGRFFPGTHHLAHFRVHEPGDEVCIQVESRDGRVKLEVDAVPTDRFQSKLFASFDEVVEFFRNAALGFSPTFEGDCLEGVRLNSASWAAHPMKVERIASSLFEDTTLFPTGTCSLDSALVIRDLPPRWETDRSISIAGQSA